MKYLQKINFILILSMVMVFSACNRELDVAPFATYDGEANCTIAELLALHDIGSEDSYDTIPDGLIISGVVTSSDEHSNCYKYINIEDETAGIQIKIYSSALYHKFPIGQRIFVNCDGLVIGDYRKLPQMGLWANGKVETIPFNRLSNYIHCDSLPTKVEPAITLTSVTNADDLPAEYFNRLVRIEGAKFVDGGNTTFSESNTSTSRDITLEGGGKIVLRTSNYADFAGELLPEGTGTITGLLTRYNNYIQLVIRSIDDLEGFTKPQTWETVFQADFTNNPFENGWTQQGSGNDWSTMSNSSFSGFVIKSDSQTDKWLVSPVINLANASTPTLSFNHRPMPNGDNDIMKCYYTTNYTGDATTTNWNEIPIDAFNSGFNEFSYNLPSDAQNSNFRFAFRYNGNGSQWYIKDINVSALMN